jgi:hypothetical protein
VLGFTPTLGQVRVATYQANMKRLKQGSMEQHMKRKCRLRNHKILEVEQLKRRRYN